MAKILLVDDDSQALESTRKTLVLLKHEVSLARDGNEALEQVRIESSSHSKFDLILTDVRMPRLGGLEFLRSLSHGGDSTPVILMTAYGRVEDAVWAMKLGAVDFLMKPFNRQALVNAIEIGLKRKKNEKSNLEQASEPNFQVFEKSSELIGSSKELEHVKVLVSQVAATQASVLISGESGTGKELIAKRIHQESRRSQFPWIAINCAAIPEQLIESELFGFEKGAFTGATVSRAGIFEAAHLGTLLLDEIGDMPFSLQAKLLRVLQEAEVRRIGSNHSRSVDFRLITSTHHDLKEFVKMGKFREDLLYRLDVIHIHVPSLRERKKDILPLAYFFLAQFSKRHSKSLARISAESQKILEGHRWPGNVRELSNVIERAVIFAEGEELTHRNLPTHLFVEPLLESKEKSRAMINETKISSDARTSITVPLGTSLKEVEEMLIRKTLEVTSGNKNKTAKLLGINSRTIYRKLYEKK